MCAVARFRRPSPHGWRSSVCAVRWWMTLRERFAQTTGPLPTPSASSSPSTSQSRPPVAAEEKCKAQRAPLLLPVRATHRGSRPHKGAHHEHQDLDHRRRRDRRLAGVPFHRCRHRARRDQRVTDLRRVGRHRENHLDGQCSTGAAVCASTRPRPRTCRSASCLPLPVYDMPFVLQENTPTTCGSRASRRARPGM